MPIPLVLSAQTPDSPALVSAARRGDAEALATLYTRHGAQLLRLAYRLTGSRADAEDVLQDVFVGLPEALRRYDERGSLPQWLRRVTARVALMRRRRIDRRSEVPLDDLATTTDDEQRAMTRALLERALAGLPDALRVVFVLREMEGHSHAEIAEILGIRRGTSEVRLHRAIRLLRTALRGAR